MNKTRLLSILIFLLILIFGTFKFYIIRELDHIFSTGLNDRLNIFLKTNNHQQYLAGWIFYHFLYIALHFIFVFVLFSKQKKIRNIIAFILIAVISTLIIIMFISKILQFEFVYDIAFDLFRNLVSLPFILLAIEGGRILFKDIASLNKKAN